MSHEAKVHCYSYGLGSDGEVVNYLLPPAMHINLERGHRALVRNY